MINGDVFSMENKKEKRGQFSSKLGFVLAASGSAVGLGNLWRFPFTAGANGGGAFVLVYFVILFIIGFTLMLGELSMGRATMLSPIGAYRKLKSKYAWIGVLGVAAGFLILSFYSVIGGWVIRYLVKAVSGDFNVTDGAVLGELFTDFIQNPLEPLVYHGIFMALTVFIVIGGVAKGIERYSKIMMPSLFVMLILLMVRSLTLPGAMEGVKFLLIPDFSKINAEVILPAVFSFGFNPEGGPGLLFITLPAVFSQMPLGSFFAVLFFILVLFAALTSSISILEVVVSYAVDERGWSRKFSTVTLAAVIFVMGIPSSLGQGLWSHVRFFGRDILDNVDFLASNVFLPLGGLLMCLFIGWVWGVDKAIDEVTNHGKLSFPLKGFWSVMIKYVAPIGILFVFAQATGLLELIMGA